MPPRMVDINPSTHIRQWSGTRGDIKQVRARVSHHIECLVCCKQGWNRIFTLRYRHITFPDIWCTSSNIQFYRCMFCHALHLHHQMSQICKFTTYVEELT